MRRRNLLAVGVVALSLFAGSVHGEPLGSYFYVMPFGGYTVFDSDTLGGALPRLFDDFNVGGRVGYRFHRWVGVELGAGFTPTEVDGPGNRKVNFTHYSGNLMLAPFDGRYGGPFLLLGGSMSQLEPENGTAIKQGNAEIGGGLQLWFTDRFGLRVEARDLMWLAKEQVTDIQTHDFIVGGALTMAIGGRSRDTDMDGVPDRRDSCANTPTGARVNAAGCPLDSDGDGVWDGLDACEGTPRGATVDARGCPVDGDGDGVPDGIDACGETARGATVDERGCPKDGDGDGIFDGLDRCEGTPQGATVDSLGCPRDSDGDGVYDGLDKCPDTQTGLKVDVSGCPIEVIERETELMDTGMIRIQNINFETGKWDILPESGPILDVVGQVMTRWPDLRIEIGGHTDHRGSNAYNQDLSQKRAQSVLSYLLQKFPALKAEQFTARGYGESNPIASNRTVEGMARNRRVEFVVQNKEVLKREIERRRLLQNEAQPPQTPPTPPEDKKE